MCLQYEDTAEKFSITWVLVSLQGYGGVLVVEVVMDWWAVVVGAVKVRWAVLYVSNFQVVLVWGKWKGIRIEFENFFYNFSSVKFHAWRRVKFDKAPTNQFH